MNAGMKRYTVVHALGTIATVLSIIAAVSALHSDVDRQDERRALAAVAEPTTVAKVGGAPLIVTRRVDLGTDAHRVLRVHGKGGFEVTVAVGEDGVWVGGREGSLGRLLKAEKASKRLGELGAHRVASWVAAFGDGTCAAPQERRDSVAWRRIPGGGAELRFGFQSGAPGQVAQWSDCVVQLDVDGSPVEVRAERRLAAAQEPRS
jgi:hypothetical protein